MAAPFPSEDWLRSLVDVLNNDPQYARIAKDWEGDIVFHVEPDDQDQGQPVTLHMDLWHGKCRSAQLLDPERQEALQPAFKLTAPRRTFVRIIQGELDPMQAMLTRKVRVDGNLVYMVRNLPTVLDFVRCCREVGITDPGPEP
jgi:putative sterol carrier protein